MKPKNILLVMIVLVLALAQTACFFGTRTVGVVGSRNVTTETRQVSDFDRVSVSSGMHLILTQGDSESLEIEAEENLLPYIESFVQGGQLIVRIKQEGLGRSFTAHKPINVRVSMIDIHGVDLSGGSEVNSEEIKTDHLELDVSGGGRVQIDDLQADSLEADLSGGSRAEIAGKIDEQTLNMSGGGKFDARDLQSETARFEISGGGNATVWVTNELDANLSGGSRVHYYGDPEVTQDTSGGSELISEGDR